MIDLDAAKRVGRGLVVATVGCGGNERADGRTQPVDGEEVLFQQFARRGAVGVDGWLGDDGFPLRSGQFCWPELEHWAVWSQ